MRVVMGKVSVAPSTKERAQYIPQDNEDALVAWVIDVHGFKIPVYKDTLINKMNQIITDMDHQANLKEGVVDNNRHLHFIRTYKAKSVLDSDAITDLEMDWAKW